MSFPRILIRSFDLDVHTHAVCWGLRQLGAEPVLWHTGRFPWEQSLSTRLYADGRSLHQCGAGTDAVDLDGYDVVWNRRRGDLALSPALHPADQDFVTHESNLYRDALAQAISPNAMWVNPPDLAERQLYKELQLRDARMVGLQIPDTLISNDPDQIADFFHEHKGQIIYKSFRSTAWSGEPELGEKVAVGYTSKLTVDDLKQVDALRTAPGIFQRAIEKAYEVRVTVMGWTNLAAKIRSQDHAVSQTDWRAAGELTRSQTQAMSLPPHISEAIQQYMALTGLRFGCFDFIVTPAGDYIFLEVNQMGQFLWKEIADPDLTLLDAFCHFLLSGKETFLYEPKESVLRFADFKRSADGQAFADKMHRAMKESIS